MIAITSLFQYLIQVSNKNFKLILLLFLQQCPHSPLKRKPLYFGSSLFQLSSISYLTTFGANNFIILVLTSFLNFKNPKTFFLPSFSPSPPL